MFDLKGRLNGYAVASLCFLGAAIIYNFAEPEPIAKYALILAAMANAYKSGLEYKKSHSSE